MNIEEPRKSGEKKIPEKSPSEISPTGGFVSLEKILNEVTEKNLGRQGLPHKFIDIEIALAKLEKSKKGKRQGYIIREFYFKNRAFRDIADELGVPNEVIRVEREEGLKRLKDLLDNKED